MNREGYLKLIEEHYSSFWNNECSLHILKGSEDKFIDKFRILKYPPKNNRSFWTYATCGMSSFEDKEALECFIFSPEESDDSLVELLTLVAYFHQSNTRLWYGHTVNFGMPWIDESLCDHGLFSLPYLDGEDLEIFDYETKSISFLWLIPITKSERDYKINHDLDALESLFEEKELNYLDPLRKSII